MLFLSTLVMLEVYYVARVTRRKLNARLQTVVIGIIHQLKYARYANSLAIMFSDFCIDLRIKTHKSSNMAGRFCNQFNVFTAPRVFGRLETAVKM